MAKLDILLADDQSLFAESLRTSLNHYAEDMNVVGIAHNGEEAVAMAARHRPDVILMDIKMPRMDGVEAVREIKPKYPDIKIIMLSTYHEDMLVRSSLRAGASGYLLKDISPTELITAIRALGSGIMQISPDIVRQLVQERYGPSPCLPPAAAEPPARQNSIDAQSFEWLDSLTRREREIFTLLVLGYENEQIAGKFDLALQTVRNQVSTIYAKLGVKNRFEIIRLANRSGK
ncbi:MAG: response regulator transcription factor [Treponema sp.]|jgi:DNA-binding NarL/FixJ family response regulator|nr:response regulator transcription factor [Treponema sp.]